MSAPTEPRIAYRVESGVAWVTLDNPRRRNALSTELADRLRELCGDIDADPGIGAAVIRGAGGFFCSGADTRELAEASRNPAAGGGLARTSAVYGAFTRFADLSVPTVALVEGGAVGAGLNLALAADVLVTTPDAVLDSGFLARGIHPGGGHIALLGRSLSTQQVMAFAVLGEALDGAEAVAHGLAYRAVPAAELESTATALVARAAADPELARRIKRSARLELGPPGVDLGAALEIERGVQLWSLARKGAEGWAARPTTT